MEHIIPTKKKTAVEEIMEKSGNSFHSRVVVRLRDLGWTALVSPYYSDNFTDKPREIDIIAQKKFDVNDGFGGWLGTVDVQLFIECKYITGDVVFWFDDKDTIRAIERTMFDTGLDHPSRNTAIQSHHYLQGDSVAKLFSSEKSKSEENELVNKAINQNLNALVYYRSHSDLFPDAYERHSVRQLRRVPYPIILVNSFEHFYATKMGGIEGEVSEINEPFQLEVNYAYVDRDGSKKKEYFLIDVVSIDTLERFLSSLKEQDFDHISHDLAWEHRRGRTR